MNKEQIDIHAAARHYAQSIYDPEKNDTAKDGAEVGFFAGVQHATRVLRKSFIQSVYGEKFRYYGNLQHWERNIYREMVEEGFTEDEIKEEFNDTVKAAGLINCKNYNGEYL